MYNKHTLTSTKITRQRGGGGHPDFSGLLIVVQHGSTVLIITKYNIYLSASSSDDTTEGGSADGSNPHDSMSSSVINLESIALNRFPMNCRRWICHDKLKFVFDNKIFLMFILIDEIYQTLQTVFHSISKHLKFHQKYYAAYYSFNPLIGIFCEVFTHPSFLLWQPERMSNALVRLLVDAQAAIPWLVFLVYFLRIMFVLITGILSCLTTHARTGSLQMFYSCFPLGLLQEAKTYEGKTDWTECYLCLAPTTSEYKYKLCISFQTRLQKNILDVWNCAHAVSAISPA